jgi:hypothetical protein
VLARVRDPHRKAVGEANMRIRPHEKASRVLEKLELNNRIQIVLFAHDAGEA